MSKRTREIETTGKGKKTDMIKTHISLSCFTFDSTEAHFIIIDTLLQICVM